MPENWELLISEAPFMLLEESGTVSGVLYSLVADGGLAAVFVPLQ